MRRNNILSSFYYSVFDCTHQCQKHRRTWLVDNVDDDVAESLSKPGLGLHHNPSESWNVNAVAWMQGLNLKTRELKVWEGSQVGISEVNRRLCFLVRLKVFWDSSVSRVLVPKERVGLFVSVDFLSVDRVHEVKFKRTLHHASELVVSVIL